MTPSEARAMRRSLDISQREAAETIGLSHAMISLYEKGERSLGKERVARLRAFYEAEGAEGPLSDEALADEVIARWNTMGRRGAVLKLIKELRK